MLALPSSYRIVGIRGIMHGEPVGCAVVVGIPVEVVYEKLPVRAEHSAERRRYGIQPRVVERHDGDGSIKRADAANMLDRFPDQPRVNGRGRIHAERIEAKFSQAVNQAAVTTPDVEDVRAGGKARGNGRVDYVHHRESAMRRSSTPGAVAAGPRRVASGLRRWLAFPFVPGGGR
jgi:hypothetical protein